MAALSYLFSILCLIVMAGSANAAVQGVFAHYMASNPYPILPFHPTPSSTPQRNALS